MARPGEEIGGGRCDKEFLKLWGEKRPFGTRWSLPKERTSWRTCRAKDDNQRFRKSLGACHKTSRGDDVRSRPDPFNFKPEGGRKRGGTGEGGGAEVLHEKEKGD